jgi:phage portal protein BeeE
LKKQTQFFPVFSPITTICQKPNPIQSQFKPNQTQFLALFNHGNTVLISVNQCLKLYLFMQNEPKFPHFQPKNLDFTKKRTQNKPKQTQFSSAPGGYEAKE